MGTAQYPGALKTYTDETNKEDLADAAVVNSLQDEVQAIEAELGTDVAGSQTDLVTRLARMMEDNGALNQGTSFPGSPNDGDIFYRTDENVVYVYNGTSWDSQGQSLSNVIFSWSGVDDITNNVHGWFSGTDISPDIASSTPNYNFVGVDGNTYETVLNFRFTKIAGISTVTVEARLWSNQGSAGQEANLEVDIGGQTGGVQSATGVVTPAWAATSQSDIDVSGLSDGTTYDGIVKLRSNGAGVSVYCSAVTLIGS